MTRSLLPDAPIAPVAALLAEPGSALRRGRTCYDHLGGVLGVALADAFVDRGWLVLEGRAYTATAEGERGLAGLGIDVGRLRTGRRAFAPACLDWSERRYHLAGALGAAICERCFGAGWMERTEEPRVARPTAAGRRALRRYCGVVVY